LKGRVVLPWEEALFLLLEIECGLIMLLVVEIGIERRVRLFFGVENI